MEVNLQNDSPDQINQLYDQDIDTQNLEMGLKAIIIPLDLEPPTLLQADLEIKTGQVKHILQEATL